MQYMIADGKELVARWQTRHGKHWFNLYRDTQGYVYRGDGCGGNLGNITEEAAISHMLRLVGYAKNDGINMTRLRVVDGEIDCGTDRSDYQ